jgi:hypothetical protein
MDTTTGLIVFILVLAVVGVGVKKWQDNRKTEERPPHTPRPKGPGERDRGDR